MPDAPRAAKKILLVDDDVAILGLFKEILSSAGYEVSTAASGEQCLEVVSGVKPDLIILDVMMPGLNGPETAAKLAANLMTAKIPIIFATNSITEAQEKLRGKRPFLSKYSAPKDFLSKVQAIMANPVQTKLKSIMDFEF